MRVLLVLLLGVAVATAASTRIIGGTTVDIRQYPFAAALIHSRTGSGTFYPSCVGSIISNRAMLTAAHCVDGNSANQWRARVGSNRSSTGGRLYQFNRIIVHPSFNGITHDCDVAVLQPTTIIAIGGNVQLGPIAGENYNLFDYSPLWAVGWGVVSWGGQHSDLLRHVQISSINQNVCRQRYAGMRNVTDNMLCSGVLDIGGRDTCTGDNGGPVIHNGVIVGIASWAYQCGHPRYPRVNTRVPRFTRWIVSYA
ncbi:trypsin, alkaline A-like [Maniola hyperantus]|uniref:trypsin, alkaline A-like n=1 Tax=Aphantopus hyperantus TaxID=2795564 RepID=UPI001568B807|nr:trypsin, alkaline A-like [Maniola hyperantus]